jgi:2-(1,2-epoxy-1,2-dihydrophenyl)acetyl-CoA isomerase
MNEVLLEQRGSVAIVTLNRPDALNAFDTPLRLGVRSMLQRVAADTAVRAVVLTAAGRGFSAGADLKEFESVEGAEVERQVNEEYGGAIRAIETMPKPVVAAVNGFAAGIGTSYVLACDLVVMGEKAFFQVPFQKIGLVPDGGMCWQLAERLGHRRAFEIAAFGERVPAAQCLEWGLCNRVVPDDRVLAEALSWAEQLSEAAPVALAGLKQMLRSAPDLGFDATLLAEARTQLRCADTQDFREGVAAFRGKRPAKFTGR